ncbi:MAG: LysR family transcriptional regulator [Bacteriovoracaceae bacterium]|nr:LysR family transcriptional regulator [Bacteriovoracaceae bacterium]
MNLNLLKTFIKVAELGSFTKAAKLLNQPKSRVSRTITRLEEDLRVELIKRSTRSISLTEAGLNLFQETRCLIADLESKIETITSEGEDITGVLSIAAPIDIGESFLSPLLNEFKQVHPNISFRIFLSDSYTDLTAYNIDVAIRVGNLKDSSLIQKKLVSSQLILAASSDYLHKMGTPKSLKDLKNHNVISFFNENQTDPLSEIYKKYSVEPVYRVNSFPLIKDLISESSGIGIIPNTICKREFSSGKFIHILKQWAHEKSTIQLVYPPTKNIPPKTRAFVDFIYERRDYFI